MTPGAEQAVAANGGQHIANALLQSSMRRIGEGAGYVLPVLRTPLELTEVPRDDR